MILYDQSNAASVHCENLKPKDTVPTWDVNMLCPVSWTWNMPCFISCWTLQQTEVGLCNLYIYFIFSSMAVSEILIFCVILCMMVVSCPLYLVGPFLGWLWWLQPATSAARCAGTPNSCFVDACGRSFWKARGFIHPESYRSGSVDHSRGKPSNHVGSEFGNLEVSS